MTLKRAVPFAILAAALVAGGVALVARRGSKTTSPEAKDGRAGEREPPHERALHPPTPLDWLAEPDLPPRRIAGRVHVEGAPVAGAIVRLSDLRSDAGVRPESRVTTGKDGRFDFGLQLPARYAVVAESPGRRAAAVVADLRDPTAEPAPDRLELELRPCKVALFGTVHDASGGVVAGARIQDQNVSLAISDESGSWELCVAAGANALRVEAEGYGAVEARTMAYGRSRIDVWMSPEAILAGTVVRDDTGLPVAGALVRADRASNDEQGNAERMAVTGEDGAFTVTGVGAGRVSLSAVADGYATATPIEMAVQAGQTVTGLELRLERTFSIAGRVVDDGKPIAGAAVMGASFDLPASLRAISQTDGTFLIRGLRPGMINMAVDEWELVSPRQIELVERDVEGVTLEVDELGSIAGRVLARGKPAAGVTVWTQSSPSWSRDVSRDGGAFELKGLREGRYKIVAESIEEGAFTQGVEVTLGRREHRTGVDIDMNLAGSVSGVVVERDGKPVAGVHVRLSLIEGRDFGFATTAADGSFKAGALSGGGEYDVTVTPTARSATILPPAEGGVFPPIHVADGSSHVTGVKLVVEVGRERISGRVVTRAGAPVPDAKVTATPWGGDGEPFFATWMDLPRTTTDVDGAFTIEGLLPDTYAVEARAPNGAWANVVGVKSGSAGTVITLSDVAGIDGTLVGFGGGGPVRVLAVDVGLGRGQYEATVKGDRFELGNLSPGRFLVTAFDRKTGDSIMVKLEEGVTKKLTLTARPSGTIEVTIVDARSGAPMPGATCHANPSGENGGLIGSSAFGAQSDEEGRVTFSASAGSGWVSCFGRGEDYFNETLEVTLAPGETKRVRMRVVSRSLGVESVDPGFMVDPARSDESVVSHVSSDGPAEAAGLREGDVIVSVDDVSLGGLSVGAVSTLIYLRDPDDPIELVIDRGGETVSMSFRGEPRAE